LEAIRFAKNHYTIVLIGHQGHDEVIGTMGEAPEAIVLVENTEEVDQLEFTEGTRLAYLTQTTLSVDDATRIIRRLQERFPWIEGPPKEDICYATQNRQEAVRLLSPQVDVVLVLGSQNSSNSQRLKELAAEQGKAAYLIDGPEDLSPSWFGASHRVLLTAGASAPEEMVKATVDWLVERYGASVRQEMVREEHVHFPLPKPLREIAKAASGNPTEGDR
jgi:4-hydroxy-3-methylbut-2-enyl diphosphate reductase